VGVSGLGPVCILLSVGVMTSDCSSVLMNFKKEADIAEEVRQIVTDCEAGTKEIKNKKQCLH
jgi:hypothetical protein